ncbi:MAG TPA: hypothetical protein VJ691_11275 [Vicinamibacterales bacterium]|nr:hypothetical protein [Vicinamibacterales bacterium]
MMRRLLALPLVTVMLLVMPAAAQEPTPQPAGRKPRVSPPQPQQPQGLDYFIGDWTFTWVGRESPITAGPREGTLTYVRKGTSGMELRAEGTIDGGAAFRETGTAEWNAGKKTMTWVERLSTGHELRSIGDWSSPIGIRAESEPVKAGSQTIRVRRLYSILSAQSYRVTEEISVNGGPYQRLGDGRFQRNIKR